MRKLGINVGMRFSETIPEQLPIIKSYGFETFFTGWGPNTDFEAIGKAAKDNDLYYEAIHSPFHAEGWNANDIWVDSPKGEKCLEAYIRCVDDCVRGGARILVVHPTIATTAPDMSELGFDRIKKLLDYAAEKNVDIAFENLEIPEYLFAMLERFDDYKNAGFCWDMGHQHCYSPDVNVMSRLGHRLICTHIHDNFGVTNPPTIHWKDDIHYLPFDGNIDWNNRANLVKESGYKGPLTLELSASNNPEYRDLTFHEMIERSAKAMKKFRDMCEN